MIKTHSNTFSWNWTSQVLNQIDAGWRTNRWCAEPLIHFYFGLAHNKNSIIKNIKSAEDYYLVDVGYMGAQTKRGMRDQSFESGYYRICKGGIHNDLTNVSDDPSRFKKLLDKKYYYARLIDNYKEKPLNTDGNILLAPSSHTVSEYQYNCSQKQWIMQAALDIKQHTNREINLRLKPIDGSNTAKIPIAQAFDNTYVLLTNMSMIAFDAIVRGIPVICDKKHVCSEIAETDYSKIEKIKPINKEDLYKWACKVANQQFTLEEIYKGVPNEYM